MDGTGSIHPPVNSPLTIRVQRTFATPGRMSHGAMGGFRISTGTTALNAFVSRETAHGRATDYLRACTEIPCISGLDQLQLRIPAGCITVTMKPAI